MGKLTDLWVAHKVLDQVPAGVDEGVAYIVGQVVVWSLDRSIIEHNGAGTEDRVVGMVGMGAENVTVEGDGNSFVESGDTGAERIDRNGDGIDFEDVVGAPNDLGEVGRLERRVVE